uniref:Putative Cro/CI family transcriptional regulator n=1 Tax=uncultured bacterium Contigcl_23 TaxID=1393667 RepID=W0FRV4_9BACT|nr:putative Cro/CI family transcriptional regulator [uncultured bacterium Contigcl_23]
MIGKNLQKLRKQKSLTQEALAEAVGVARQTIAKWESEESTPDLEMSGKLASVLNVSLDDLVYAPEGELDGKPGMQGKHMFGVVTVGDKGQIVIPVRARRVFHINPGDQLMVLGDENSGLALVNAKFFLRMAEDIKNGF